MVDDSLRRRLESLNRAKGGMLSERSDVSMIAPRESMTPQCGAKAPATRHGEPRATKAASPSKIAGSRARVVQSMPGLLHRGDVVETSAGEHLRIRLPLDELWPGGSQLVAARQEYLRQLHNENEQEPVVEADFAAFAAALPDRVLLLDLETCGLAGAALFLVGLLRYVDGKPTVELLLARNYAEEQAILESLWQTVAAHDVLVTFNGKSFDWPMVVDRSRRHLLDQPDGQCDLIHVDVLHHARRRWRGELPDCRLQTLEERICRRRREDDIPGQFIPAAYADYVRTGFGRDMDAILFHNAVDLVTLLDLALRLAA